MGFGAWDESKHPRAEGGRFGFVGKAAEPKAEKAGEKPKKSLGQRIKGLFIKSDVDDDEPAAKGQPKPPKHARQFIASLKAETDEYQPKAKILGKTTITREEYHAKFEAASVSINVPTVALEGVVAAGRFKSVYERVASGDLKSKAGDYLKQRTEWEQTNFELDANAKLEERPIYGALNLHGMKDGAAGAYGQTWFELKHECHTRITVSEDNTSATFEREQLASLSSRRASDRIYDSRLKWHTDPADKDHYIEAQIWGGVDLARDVEAFHIAKSYVDPGGKHYDAKVAAAVERIRKLGVQVVEFEGND